MNKRDKKGSHVEVIISFIIFITFIFFLFSIVEPSIGTKNDKKNILDNIETGIIDRISADMDIITIRVITSTSQNCIELDEEITSSGMGSGIVSKGSSGESLSCYISSGDSDDLRIERTALSDNFLKVYSSSAFPSIETSSSGCQSLQRGTGYSLGLTKTGNYIFETKMLSLINEDYETLKRDLKIPEGINFGYGILLSNGTSFDSINEELSTNIYMREKPIEYVNSEGGILMGTLRIKVW